MGSVYTSGNKGKGIRSDCFITLEKTRTKTPEILVESKVQVMYGKDIRKLIDRILTALKIDHVKIHVEDSGALPFVIAARLESVIRMAFGTKKEFLPDLLPQNKYHTARERNRFSRLYLPGNTPNLMINAGIHKPDGIILDLEDAVAPDKKFEARFIVRNALRTLDFYGAERMVRINQVPMGLDDLEFIVPHYINLILIPKCEHADQVIQVSKKIDTLQKTAKVNYSIWLMPIIESALGVMNAYPIALASDKVVAMAIGLEDYTADLGTRRTPDGTESFFARSMVVNAARAAGIQPIDSVFSDVNDMEGLKQNVIRSKALGFDGMGCIHPRQIKVIHEGFAPEAPEIEKAGKIVLAYENAISKGLGVVALGSKMIDAPVVKRALKTIDLAVSMGILNANWKESENEKK
ncbi:MAG: citrate lyase ACP [Bacteroidetes bacterium]|nr:citrate lyase ACP [Bacteroidota bacterium]